MKGKIGGLPISYDKASAIQTTLKNKDLWKTDIDGFNSKVGFYTNIASTYHTLLSDFEKGSPEHVELHSRLIKLRRAQGEAIDTAKNGGAHWPVPDNWTKWTKITDNMTNEEKLDAEFNNSIIAEKRPVFMRFLYGHYNKKYTQERRAFDFLSWKKFGTPFEEIYDKKDKNSEEERFIQYFKRKSFFLHSDSTMNRVSDYMQKNVSEIKSKAYKMSKKFDYRILLSKDFSGVSQEGLDAMIVLLRKYNRLKKRISRTNREYDTLQELNTIIKKEAFEKISSSGSELADTAVIVCYGVMRNLSRSFVWNVFGDELIQNLLDKSSGDFEIPVPSLHQEIRYLYSNYEMKKVRIV